MLFWGLYHGHNSLLGNEDFSGWGKEDGPAGKGTCSDALSLPLGNHVRWKKRTDYTELPFHLHMCTSVSHMGTHRHSDNKTSISLHVTGTLWGYPHLTWNLDIHKPSTFIRPENIAVWKLKKISKEVWGSDYCFICLVPSELLNSPCWSLLPSTPFPLPIHIIFFYAWLTLSCILIMSISHGCYLLFFTFIIVLNQVSQWRLLRLDLL